VILKVAWLSELKPCFDFMMNMVSNFYVRYVEIFKSSMMEAENAIAIQGRYDVPSMGGGGRGGARPSPYDRPNVRGGMARGTGAMRGITRGGRGGIKSLTGWLWRYINFGVFVAFTTYYFIDLWVV
jgi:hypothetical protein